MGKLEVDDVADAVHVKSTGGDIGRHQHPRMPGPKPLQRGLTSSLRFVAMDRVRGDPHLGDLLGDPVCPMFGAREHQHAGQCGVVQELAKQLGLVRAVHEVHELLHGIDRGGGRRDLHSLRPVQDLLGQTGDVRRHGRREQHRAALARQLPDDLSDVVDEAHVEHAVRFIEDEKGDPVEANVALFEQIQQAARCRHHDVGTARERGHLRTLRNAAQDDRLTQTQAGAIVAKVVMYLHRKLARRRQHQRPRRVGLGPLACGSELLQYRQGKRGGLAGSCLRDAKHVLACQERRDGLLLNESWR